MRQQSEHVTIRSCVVSQTYQLTTITRTLNNTTDAVKLCHATTQHVPRRQVPISVSQVITRSSAS